MFLNGTFDGTLQQIQVVEIHGTRFYDLVFSHDDEPQRLYRARLGAESIYKDPRPGDSVTISYLMNMPVEITAR